MMRMERTPSPLPPVPAPEPQICALSARPVCTPAERAADNAVHVIGVLTSVAACAALLTYSSVARDGATTAILAIYALAMTAVFLISAAYHLADAPRVRAVLRRLDHAAIFVKIAGTYTPFAALAIGGGWGVGLLGAVWGVAAVGVPLKLFAPARLERIAVWLYLAQGWMIIVAIGPLMDAVPPETLGLIVAGGLVYTAGVGFFLAERLPFNVAIWHLFVLVGSSLMFAAVVSGVAIEAPVLAETAQDAAAAAAV